MTEDMGPIIYTTVKPILKIYLIISTGFWLGRNNILSVKTCKSLSNLVVSIFLPALAFDKIVNNLDNSYLKQIGILTFISILVYALGGALSLVVYKVTKVPKYWFGGCLSCGLFPNVAELPIAYVSSLSFLFTEAEIEMGTTYVIVIMVTYCLIQFNFGATRLIEQDFKIYRQINSNARANKFIDSELAIGVPTSSAGNSSDLNQKEFTPQQKDHLSSSNNGWNLDKMSVAGQRSSIAPISSKKSLRSTKSAMPNLEIRRQKPEGIEDIIADYNEQDVFPRSSSPTTPRLKSGTFKKKFLRFIKFFMVNSKKPISVILVVSLVVAMIPWVRALFVTSKQYSFPAAPDKKPPLSFVMEISGYLANVCVPMGILILGATLSRLKMDKESLAPRRVLTPLLICLCRTVIQPIIGVAIITKLKNSGSWFDGDKVLTFVCTLIFGIPCGTALIYLTASMSDGHDYQMQSLASVFIFQYAVLFITLPFLTTYTALNLL